MRRLCSAESCLIGVGWSVVGSVWGSVMSVCWFGVGVGNGGAVSGLYGGWAASWGEARVVVGGHVRRRVVRGLADGWAVTGCKAGEWFGGLVTIRCAARA